MIIKTPAILLRAVPTANTSRVLNWLTPAHGRVATMVKGALRPKSWFLGQFDLFYTCELLYYARTDRDLFIARECCPLNTRNRFRQDWRAFAIASYFTDLATRISLPNTPHPTLYHWLEAGLDELATDPLHEPLIYWRELQLLDDLGLTPRLTHCMGCGRPLAPPGAARFSSRRGGLLCDRCVAADTESSLTLPPDVMAMLQTWQKTTTPQPVRRVRAQPQQLGLIRRLLGEFLRYHLDLALPSRDLALTIVRR
jgi:DNA repair protein RecO (recombination protein O)